MTFGPELLPSDYLTFDAWIKPDEEVYGQMLAMLGEWGWGIMLMCPDGEGRGCCGSHVRNAIGFWSETGEDAGACAATLSSKVGVTRGRWNHISVVVDATQQENVVRFYIDGLPAGNLTSNVLGNINDGNNPSNNNLVFGQAPCPGGCLNYKGFLDELTIVNDAWTGEEIDHWKLRHFEKWMPGYERVILGFHFDFAYGPVVTNEFNEPGQTGAKFDAILNTSDVNFVVWDNETKVDMTRFPQPPPPPSPPPQPGPASLYFNGKDTDVTLNFTQQFAPQDVFTFEAWVKPGNVTKSQFIASVEHYGWGVSIMCSSGGVGCCANHLNGGVFLLYTTQTHS